MTLAEATAALEEAHRVDAAAGGTTASKSALAVAQARVFHVVQDDAPDAPRDELARRALVFMTQARRRARGASA